METATPVGLPPRDAPAADVTGPDMTPADVPQRAATGHLPSVASLALTALAGIALAALVGGGKHRSSRRLA